MDEAALGHLEVEDPEGWVEEEVEVDNGDDLPVQVQDAKDAGQQRCKGGDDGWQKGGS